LHHLEPQHTGLFLCPFVWCVTLRGKDKKELKKWLGVQLGVQLGVRKSENKQPVIYVEGL